MKTIISWAITIAIITGVSWWINPSILAGLGRSAGDTDRIMSAWRDKTSNIIVEVDARVVLLLPDQGDYENVQKFYIRLENSHRLMVEHNLDTSQYVPVGVNNKIRLKGEYDWNETGGVIHWTHKDTTNTREGGWIEHNGTRYQ